MILRALSLGCIVVSVWAVWWFCYREARDYFTIRAALVPAVFLAAIGGAAVGSLEAEETMPPCDPYGIDCEAVRAQHITQEQLVFGLLYLAAGVGAGIKARRDEQRAG